MKKKTAQWITKAKEDDEAAAMLLKYEFPAYAPICFHLQQAAEKYLKALIIECDLHLSKTHNLLQLLDDSILDSFPDFEKLTEQAKLLSSYGVEPRYPGDYPALTINNAEQAQEAMITIKEAVLKELKNK